VDEYTRRVLEKLQDPYSKVPLHAMPRAMREIEDAKRAVRTQMIWEAINKGKGPDSN
jgi:hypothetical protein